MGTPSGPLLRVQLIGRLRITIGGRILDAAGFGGTRPRQLLEILLLNRGTTLSRNEIIGLLWGPDPPGNPTATLQAYISILRDRLQPGQRASGPLRTTGEGYRIEPGLIDLDLDRFEALTRAAVRAAPERAYILLCRALALVAGPLLADEPDPDWAETARARHTLRVTEPAFWPPTPRCGPAGPRKPSAGPGRCWKSIRSANRPGAH